MMNLRIALYAVLALAILALPASTRAAQATSLQATITQILQTYLDERRAAEHITAISASVGTIDRAAPLAAAVGAKPSTLFQIGSNTKAFTAILALQLEAAGKLNLDAPIGTWLPQYPAWKSLTIRRMLNMTSGLPTYDDDLAFERAYAENPYKQYAPAELVGFVYPKNGRAKFFEGWHYSNTGYILTQMILERVTGHSYADLLQTRIFKPYGLSDVYYDANLLPASLQGRLSSGYFFSKDPDNAGLQLIYKRDVRNFSLSWAQAAGGIVATPIALDRWVRVLYGSTLLPKKQRDELLSTVSMETGKPLLRPTAAQPRTFGLGVGEMYRPPLGRFMFYEGMTLGYRVVHVYAPERNLVLTLALNSQPDAKEDHVGVLIDRIVAAILPQPAGAKPRSIQ